MYVRELKSNNGKTYVQVVDKSSGKYKVIKNIGSSSDKNAIRKLLEEGNKWIKDYTGQQELDFANTKQSIDEFFNSIRQMKLIGLELLLGKLFDDIGFNQIKDSVFKQLVIQRIAFPRSKLKTVEYLKRYQHID